MKGFALTVWLAALLLALLLALAHTLGGLPYTPFRVAVQCSACGVALVAMLAWVATLYRGAP